jgi:hypothetical protein
MQKEEVLAYRENFRARAKEYYKNLSQVFRSLGRDAKQGPPEC